LRTQKETPKYNPLNLLGPRIDHAGMILGTIVICEISQNNGRDTLLNLRLKCSKSGQQRPSLANIGSNDSFAIYQQNTHTLLDGSLAFEAHYGAVSTSCYSKNFSLLLPRI